MTIVEGKIGPPGLGSDNAGPQTVRLARTGEQVVQDGNFRFDELVSRGRVFSASNQAGKAVTPFATSSTTGFVLLNPAGSGIRLSIMEILIAQAVAATTAICTVSLCASLPNSTAFTGQSGALALRNNLIGSNTAPSALAYEIVTSKGTADTIVRNIWSPSVSATATTGVPAVIKDQVDGAISILPGNWVALAATTAMTCMATISWTETAI